MVFVHGFTTTSEFWREQAEEFSKAYRVIRINLPGHGASPAPTSRSYCLEDFVEDVNRVFRELSIEKAILIGLSMGGIVAQEFALKYGHLVEALVLVEAHIFVAFLAYCMHVTLRARLKPLAPGLTSRAVLDKMAAVQMLDVHFPTTDGRMLILSRYTELNADQKLLLKQLKLDLPPQPPPRITSSQSSARPQVPVL